MHACITLHLFNVLSNIAKVYKSSSPPSPSLSPQKKKERKRERRRTKAKKKKKISASSVSPDFPQEFHHFIFVKRPDTGLVPLSRRGETRRQIKAARVRSKGKKRKRERSNSNKREREEYIDISSFSDSHWPLKFSSQTLHFRF